MKDKDNNNKMNSGFLLISVTVLVNLDVSIIKITNYSLQGNLKFFKL